MAKTNDVKVESPRWIFDLRLIVQFFPFPLRPQRSQTKNQQTYNYDSIKKEPNPQPINRATEDIAITERRIAIQDLQGKEDDKPFGGIASTSGRGSEQDRNHKNSIYRYLILYCFCNRDDLK